MKNNPALGIAVPVAATTFFRIVLNTARRFAYPFAPVLSRGLGVPFSAVTSLIALNQLVSILGLFFGPLIDRLGYKKTMITGLLLLSMGMITCFFLPVYATVMLALLLAGLGKSLFDPAVQAWVGQRVPIGKRGFVIGIMEFSWSGSTLMGIPVIAVIIDRFGWRWPFLFLGILGVIGAFILHIVLPSDNVDGGPAKRIDFKKAMGKLFYKREALGAMGYVFFTSAANDNLFVVYGAWLENNFGLGILAIGIGTSVIGIAELLGEGLTAVLSDRIGLKPAVMIGIVMSAASYLLLPVVSTSLPLALFGLFILFCTFEFTIVTSISLCTEILPESRATMMAGFFAAAGIGRVVGALSGGPVWLFGGILATGIISAVFCLFGLVFLFWGLKTR